MRTKKSVRHNKDILWKAVLEWVMEDMLRFVFSNADEVFDFEKGFQYLDKELAELYPEPAGKTDIRYVDQLVKVYRKTGEEEWVLVHIEIQDKTKAGDRLAFSERMFDYFVRCRYKYHKPVAAIAVFCGLDGKLLPDTYRYEFMGTRLEYGYNTICLLDYTDEELAASENPFAWVMLAAKKALLSGKNLDSQLLEGKLFVFRKLYEKGIFDKPKLQAVFRFLNSYVRFENQETMRTFKKEIDMITDKKHTMDIVEITNRMLVEEEVYFFVENLLNETDLPDDKIASIARVSNEFVAEVKAELKRKKRKKEA